MKKKNIILTLIFFMFFCAVFCQTKNKSAITKKTDYKIFVLNDIRREGNTDILISPNADTIAKYIPSGSFPLAINAFLVQQNGENFLFDTGLGINLVGNLKSHGVLPEQISKIFITHCHGDHIGGLLNEGEIVFPHAEILINRIEYNYWTQEGNELFAQVANRYKEKIKLFDLDENRSENDLLYSDIQPVAAYGHTPGHTMYLIGTEENQTLVWGDLTHVIPLQMPHPEQSVTYDVNPQQAAETRQRIFKFLSENHIKVAGMHLPLPAFGFVTKGKSIGYEFNSYKKQGNCKSNKVR
ncbi:MAG: MBL fold metallo-hydrolase [Flavobacteriaceae bacterium]|jgi:glyoxylase-like metal-dependent hydrolase (beta-lactamase superfamily II)|nr:MBL fold metallo-hydrolase [Flavobacteriaceae bacterium]